MVIKSPYATSYLMAIVMFDLSVTIVEISTVEMCLTGSRSNANMTIKIPYVSICDCIYLMAIVMLAISFTHFEIFTVEMCMTMTLAFRLDQGQM